MEVSAVGFLFQQKIKGKRPLRGKNYTCIIHKINPDGNYNRNLISAPIKNENSKLLVPKAAARGEFYDYVFNIGNKTTNGKFKGATIKDGKKETEIHSLFSDKLFAVRTKDEFGKNHFGIKSQKKVKSLLSKNLYLNA